MPYCININHPEFKKLQRKTKMSAPVLAAKLYTWQTRKALEKAEIHFPDYIEDNSLMTEEVRLISIVENRLPVINPPETVEEVTLYFMPEADIYNKEERETILDILRDKGIDSDLIDQIIMDRFTMKSFLIFQQDYHAKRNSVSNFWIRTRKALENTDLITESNSIEYGLQETLKLLVSPEIQSIYNQDNLFNKLTEKEDSPSFNFKDTLKNISINEISSVIKEAEYSEQHKICKI